MAVVLIVLVGVDGDDDDDVISALLRKSELEEFRNCSEPFMITRAPLASHGIKVGETAPRY